jgi:integrase
VRGYVAQRRNRFYAVIYEGIDPITGRERRRWHPAGTNRVEAEELATALAAAHGQRQDGRRVGPTFGVYLTTKWLPAKQLTLRPSTWDGYRRLIELHVLPHLGRVPLRHLRTEHLDRLYATLLERGRSDGRGGLDTKTVHEVHIVLRRALRDAERRGSIIRNPAELAHAPKRRPLTSSEFRAWNADQLGSFLALAQTSTYFTALWLAANTGMRRGEVLGLRWGDVDLESARLSVNRSLISVAYELHESRGKTRTARRTIDLDERTVGVLGSIRKTTPEEDSYVFCHEDGSPIHPQVLSDAFKRLVSQSGLPRIRLHDLRHTHTPRCFSRPGCRSRS